MSSEAANNSLANEIADITECSICAEVFKEPRCLPCAHTFCLGCLEAYGKGLKPSAKALCPMCRKKFTVPAGGWKNLPRNYIVEKLLSTRPGRTAVKNSNQEGTSFTADHLSKSVSLHIDKYQQLSDQLKARAAYLSQKSEDVRRDIIGYCEELKRLVDSSGEELLQRLDHICESTIQKLTADQEAIETRCSELKVIETKLKEVANVDDPKHYLEAISAEMKPLMLETRCDVLDADLSFTEARLQTLTDMNIVGSVEICNKAQIINSAGLISPKLLHTLNPSDNIDAVIGLGVIDDIVYVIRSWTSNVERYNSTSLQPMKPVQVLSLDLPHDMVVCSSQKCLYLSDYGPDIHRIEVAGYQLQTKWSAGDRPTGLSVTLGAANVMVTYENGQKVHEYTSRGLLLREMTLSTGLLNPHQTLLLSSQQILVCHGFESDPVNRVCILDSSAKKIVLAVGTSGGEDIGSRAEYQLTQPIRMTVSESQGVIYIADFKNDRVLVVNLSSLAVQCVLTAGGMRRPYRICMDDNGLLYVGSWETGQVLVYDTCSL